MPTNLFGIQYQSAGELRQEQEQAVQQMKQQAFQSGDPAQIQVALQKQMVANLFGNQEIKKAKARDAVIAAALNKVTRNDGETEIDFTKRMAQEVYDNMKNVDPAFAAQIIPKMADLDNAALEREKLKLGIAAEEQNVNSTAFANQMLRTPVIYALDTKTGDRNPIRIGTEKMDPGVFANEVDNLNEAARKNKESVVYQLGNGSEMFTIEDLFAAKSPLGGGGSGGKFTGTQAKQYGQIEAELDQYLNVNSLVKDLMQSPFALAPGVKETSELAAKVVNAIDSAANVLLGDVKDTTEYMLIKDDKEKAAYLDEVKATNQQAFDQAWSRGLSENPGFAAKLDRLRKQGRNARIIQAKVNGLAYSIAKAMDSGGRLSDKDVEIAMEMILGDSSPEAIMKLLSDRLGVTTARNAALRMGMGQGLLGHGEVGMALVEDVEREQQNFADLVAQFIEMKKGWEVEEVTTAPASGETKEQRAARIAESLRNR